MPAADTALGRARRVPPGIWGCLPSGVLQIHTFSIAFPKQPLPPSDALTQASSSTARLGGWIRPPPNFPTPSPYHLNATIPTLPGAETGLLHPRLLHTATEQLLWWCWPRAGCAAGMGEGSPQQPETPQGEHPASPCEELLGSTGHGATVAPCGRSEDAGEVEALTSPLLQQPQTGALLPLQVRLRPRYAGRRLRKCSSGGKDVTLMTRSFLLISRACCEEDPLHSTPLHRATNGLDWES